MRSEIGSEFWIDNILSEPNSTLPKWLSKFGDVTLTSSGRGAITLLLNQLKPRFKTVLMPAYICDSVILPFIKHGYKCYFYDINEDLSPDINSINQYKHIGIFLHMGYYGFPTNCKLLETITYFKSHSTVIVEDVTHTLFSNNKRFKGNDYYVASIRKWFALPSGGFLASSNINIESNLVDNEVFSNIRKQALLLKAQYFLNYDESVKTQYLELFSKAEVLLDKDVSAYNIDDLSKELINSLGVNELIEKRKSNFKMLAQALKCVECVEPIFNNTTETVCPMFYPVLIDNCRNEVRKMLQEEKIYCPVHWPIPEQIESNNYKSSIGIYNNVLSIPCDQRYDMNDMEKVISVFNGI